MSVRTTKTSITVLITTLALAFMYSAVAQADDTTTTTTTDITKSDSDKPSKSESYLKDIRDTLQLNINKLPVYLNQLTKMSLSWLAPDDSTATATLQNHFTTLANEKLENAQTQTDSQNQFLSAFIPAASKDSADITYQTMLLPLTTPSSASQNNAIFNYTLYASGLNIQHTAPDDIGWRPGRSLILYKNYYYTASAVQTYNGYILSELYANSKNGNKIKKTQDSLVHQANGSDWFTQIASENIGIVLRQILLYNSQTYVVLTQLLDTQQKLLTAQVMNNALLIAVNQESESRLYTKAASLPPD